MDFKQEIEKLEQQKNNELLTLIYTKKIPISGLKIQLLEKQQTIT